MNPFNIMVNQYRQLLLTSSNLSPAEVEREVEAYRAHLVELYKGKAV